MKYSIDEIDPKRVEAIKKQSIYNRSIDVETRVSTAFNHIRSLRRMKREATRLNNEGT